MAYLRNLQKTINSQFSTINYPGLRAAERPTNRAEVYAEPVEVKNNHAEPKFNRAEVKGEAFAKISSVVALQARSDKRKSESLGGKSNRAETKSNRAGTGIPLAMRFCSYAKKMNLQGNTLALFRARFARIARILT
jgi:hypothetical protein